MLRSLDVSPLQGALSLYCIPRYLPKRKIPSIMPGSGKFSVLAAVLVGLAGLFVLLVSPKLGRVPASTESSASRVAYATTVALLGALPKANAFAAAGPLARTPSVIGARAPLGLSMALRRFWGVSVGTPSRTRKLQTTYLRSLTGSSAVSVSGGSTILAAAATAPDVSLGSSGPKRVLVPVADGSEEIESVTIIDTLVRAGASVTVASVGEDTQVTCSRGVKLVADCKIAECEEHPWDAVVCPGGMPGATHLKESAALEAILNKQNLEGRIVAAICAAPAVVLASHGLLDGKKATCYPAPPFIAQIPERVDEKVVVDGNIITSQGPATAMPFALQLVESLFGTKKAEEIGKQMLVA